MDPPGEMARREDRLKAVAKAKISDRAEVRDVEAEAAYEEKKSRREALKAKGKKLRGAAPYRRTLDKDKDQINLTDEMSQIMPIANGFVQGFSAQSAVDTKTMLVMAARVAQDVNGKRQLQSCWTSWRSYLIHWEPSSQ